MGGRTVVVVLLLLAQSMARAASGADNDLINPPVPTNYSVSGVYPRRIPVAGTGPDGQPQMLVVRGRNFTSLAGLPLYCWLSESNCGWHWTLVMNYLNTTARLINDTVVECPAPAFTLGGRAILSVFPDRPYRSSAADPGLRTTRLIASGVKGDQWHRQRQVGVRQPPPTIPQPPGYSEKMAACVVQDLSVADALSYEGYSNPWAEPLSVSVEYFPLLTMATARFPFTIGSPSEMLLTVAPEVRMESVSDLRVTIVLLAMDSGVNVTLASSVHVEPGRTTRVSFSLSLVKRWEKVLTNATAVLSGAVVGGRGGRSVIASTYCRFLFAGPPIPTQIITDHASGTLLGEGDTKVAVQGWYQGWSKFEAKRVVQMTDRASYRGANGVLSAGMPGNVELPGANANATLAAQQWKLNDERLDDAIAFIKHAHSVGLWVIADVTTLWGLQGTVGYNGSDCCTTHKCPCYPNAGPHGNQTMLATMRHQLGRLRDTPGLLGYTTGSAGLWFTSSAYTLYQVLKTVDPYHPTMLVMGGAGGAVINYETVDVVMPEAYEGPMGCAAVVNCVRSYPNDWSVVGDYGPGSGDEGQLYSASYAIAMAGGRANMWFMENYINEVSGKVEANTADFQLHALGPSMWSARLYPELQPALSATPAVKIMARGYAQPCGAETNPCANYGVARTAANLPWPRPRIQDGCLIHLILLNTGEPMVINFDASVRIPGACGCPSTVNATQLFQGSIVAGAVVPLILRPVKPGSSDLVANFSGSIGRYGTTVLQLNCSGSADDELPESETAARPPQLVVNPSFEIDCVRTPSLVGGFESFGQWRESPGQQAGDSNPLMPSIAMPVDTPFGTIRPGALRLDRSFLSLFIGRSSKRRWHSPFLLSHLLSQPELHACSARTFARAEQSLAMRSVAAHAPK